MNTRRAWALMLALALVLALGALAACSGEAEPDATPDPAPADGGGDALDGEALMNEKCGGCHSLDQVLNADYDAVGWAATIDRMIAKGADVSTEEAAAIAEYLSLR